MKKIYSHGEEYIKALNGLKAPIICTSFGIQRSDGRMLIKRCLDLLNDDIDQNKTITVLFHKRADSSYDEIIERAILNGCMYLGFEKTNIIMSDYYNDSELSSIIKGSTHLYIGEGNLYETVNDIQKIINPVREAFQNGTLTYIGSSAGCAVCGDYRLALFSNQDSCPKNVFIDEKSKSFELVKAAFVPHFNDYDFLSNLLYELKLEKQKYDEIYGNSEYIDIVHNEQALILTNGRRIIVDLNRLTEQSHVEI